MMTTEKPKIYRVTAALIQIMTPNPRATSQPSFMESTQRHFYGGDILPEWVPDEELVRLESLGFIEAVKGNG